MNTLPALFWPSLWLAIALWLLFVAVLALHARFQRGMGRRPMSTPRRATYPLQKALAGPARLPLAPLPLPHPHGAALRGIKRSKDPRGAALAHPWPFTSLINKTAAGAAGVQS